MAEDYTGTEGDDALADGLDIMDGEEDRRDGWKAINKTRDMIAQLKAWVTSQISSINLTWGSITGTLSAQSDLQTALNAKLTRSSAQYTADFASRDNQISNKLDKAGGTITGTLGVNGQLFVGDKPPASFSFVVAYFNGDNRLSAGASSRRFKDGIIHDPEIPDMFSVPIAEYEMTEDPDRTRRFGYIAEDLADSDLERFVVYDEDGIPFSYDMMALLLAQCAQLDKRLRALEEGQ